MGKQVITVISRNCVLVLRVLSPMYQRIQRVAVGTNVAVRGVAALATKQVGLLVCVQEKTRVSSPEKEQVGDTSMLMHL